LDYSLEDENTKNEKMNYVFCFSAVQYDSMYSMLFEWILIKARKK